VSSRPLRFPLSLHLGTLAVGLGCFPLDCETHLPQSDCPAQAGGIRSLVGLGNLTAPKSIQCSTSASHARTLALKLFRGEQAISRFAWHFTPTHSSSDAVATATGSSLQRALPRLHSGHGELTGFRDDSMPLYALFRLAFAAAPAVPALTSRHRLTRRLILQKARGQAGTP